MAFAEERWDEAVAVYGRLVEHLLEGGFAEGSDAIAGCRYWIAIAFMRGGDFAAAETMLAHLTASAPEYEPARTRALLEAIRAAQGLPSSPSSLPPISPPSLPPVEEPRFEGPIRVGGDVTRPVLVSQSPPEYTSTARKNRIQGVVILEATIDEYGNVTDARVLKPLPMGLDQAAVDAVKQWKFTPATYRGRSVAVYYNLTVNFRLQ